MQRAWITEVLELASKGYTYKQIGQQVGVTESAIKSIVHNHMRDNNYVNITHAVAEALRGGKIK